MKKYLPYILIGLFIVIIFIAIYFLSKPAQTTTPVQPTNPSNPTANLISQVLGGILSSGWLKNIFGKNNDGTVACDSSNPGYDNLGRYTTACGGVLGGGANCDPANPGYDVNGFLSTNCGA